MILQVLADSGQIVERLDAEGGQLGAGPKPGELEQLR